MSHPKDFPAIARAAAKTAPFVQMMDDLMGMNQEGMPPSQLYAQLVERLDYLEYLKQDDPEKAEERVENVQELSSMLQRYEEEAGEGASLSGFLEEVSLFTDIDNYDAGADSAVLMTIHSAKGLEFPVVFLPGWEEGVFPSGAVLYLSLIHICQVGAQPEICRKPSLASPFGGGVPAGGGEGEVPPFGKSASLFP